MITGFEAATTKKHVMFPRTSSIGLKVLLASAAGRGDKMALLVAGAKAVLMDLTKSAPW